MTVDLGDLNAFVAVARAGGFRDAARASGGSASGSERGGAPAGDAARRAAAQPHHAQRRADRGRRTPARTARPALGEVEAALDVVNGFRDRPAGTLRLNVPVSAARLVLPAIVPPFLAAYPDIRLEVVAEESFVDVLAAGCDAGIRYDERLEQDMIAVPIGPRVQRFATAAAPAYLDATAGRSIRAICSTHACLRGRFPSGAMPTWEFERDGEVVRVDPTGPLLVRPARRPILRSTRRSPASASSTLFEDWLRPHLDSGALEPVLEAWWQRFSGPFLYYPGRRLVPAPLRAFIDFIKASPHQF